MRRRTFYPFVLATALGIGALVACARDTGDSATDTATAAVAEGEQDTLAAGDVVQEEQLPMDITASVTGGPSPTELTASGEGSNCGRSTYQGRQSWLVNYPRDPYTEPTLKELRFFAPDLPDGGTTDKFEFAFRRESPSGLWGIQTTMGAKSGSGTARLERQGQTARIEINGTAHEGGKLRVTIHCKKI